MVAKLETQRELIDGLKAKLGELETVLSQKGAVEREAAADQMATLREALATQEQELQNEELGGGYVDGDGGGDEEGLRQEQLRLEYEDRGIDLFYFADSTTHPHLVNFDVDNFRSRKFMYVKESKSRRALEPKSRRPLKPEKLSYMMFQFAVRNMYTDKPTALLVLLKL